MKPNMLQNLDAEKSGDDRRVIHRQPQVDDGRLVVARFSTLDCIIKDFHGGGARVVLKTAIDVPWEDLTLELLARGLAFPASKVWQSEDEIGLRFTGNAVSGL